MAYYVECDHSYVVHVIMHIIETEYELWSIIMSLSIVYYIVLLVQEKIILLLM